MSRMSATDRPEPPAPTGAARDAVPAAAGPLEGAVWSLIGNTPLARLRRIEPHPGVEIHAKLESRNPGGSVKDRAAASMIREGLRTGALVPGKTLLDASSGNTGIALAMLGAALGYTVKLCVPSNVSSERKRLLDIYGADVVWTNPLEGSDGAIREARRLFALEPAALLLRRPGTATRPTGGRTTTRPRSRSWPRPAGASRTSSPASARAARSWAPAGG